MENDKKRKLHIGITIAVMVFIFVQSALPGDLSGAESNIIVQLLHSLTGADAEVLSLFVRKAAHFTEYLILGACLAINTQDYKIESSKAFPKWKLYLIPWLIGTAYAVTDEIHQLFVPDRACAFLDVCIDSAGVACGIALAIAFLARKRTQSEEN